MKTEQLIKYIKGEVNAQEIKEVVEWLNSNPHNVREYKALSKLYAITVFSNTKIEALPQKSKYQLKTTIYSICKYAAIIILILSIKHGYDLITQTNHPQIAQARIVVPIGQRAELYLPDSTKVWVNSNSELSYSTDFNNSTKRIVSIKGEAYFDVAHKKNTPFIVKSELAEIEVLGTEFNINTNLKDNSTEVSLISGSIRLLSNLTKEELIMKPAQTASLRGNEIELETRTDNSFLWKEGILSFNKKSLNQIFSDLERIYNIKIIINKTNILDRYYTGKFSVDDGITSILQLLQFELKFNYRVDNLNKTIIIS